MPTILSEDAASYTVIGPDGQPMVVAKTPGTTGMLTPSPSLLTAPVTVPTPLQRFGATLATPPVIDNTVDPTLPSSGLPAPTPPTPIAPMVSHAPAMPDPTTQPAHVPGQGLEAMPPQPPLAAAANPPGVAFNPMGGFGLMDRGLKMQEDAARQAGEAQSTAKAQEAQVYDAFQAAQNESMQRAQGIIKQRDADLGKFEQDINNSHIDPRRLWNSKSGGEKAMSVVGLIISGIGAGLTGQPNAALSVIQKQIDQDIDAQKMEMDKKQNMYGMLYRKYGNALEAEAMLRQYISVGLEAQVKKIGATADSTEAKARAQALVGQLEMKRGEVQQQLGQLLFQRELMGRMLQGQGQQDQGGRQYIPTRITGPGSTASPMDPGTWGKAREEQRSANEAVTVDLGKGLAVRTRTPKDADTVRSQTTAYQKFLGAADQLEKLNPSAAGYDALVDTVATEYAKTVNQGNLNTAEVEGYKKAIPNFLRGGGRFDSWRTAAHRALGDTFGQYADLNPQQFGQVFPSPVQPAGFTAMAKVH